ncbi:MAG: RNA polymerase sigma-70 factor [Chlorobi bacterium]|nr:RNA polymerase sigma-70 factor [Chlorobiota bacterium]
MTRKTGRDSEDKELIKRFAEGDEDAFKRIFKKYYTPMVLFASGYLHDKDRAESIVQDVFVALWDKRFVSVIGSVKGYLVVAVRNKCHNELKRQGIMKKYEKSFEEEPYVLPEYPDGEYMKRITAAIEELPPKRREIFKLNRIEGLRYKEIAKELSISPKTVEVQIGQALKFLRERLMPLKKQLLG